MPAPRFKGVHAADVNIRVEGPAPLSAPSPYEGEIAIVVASRTSAAAKRACCSRWALTLAVPSELLFRRSCGVPQQHGINLRRLNFNLSRRDSGESFEDLRVVEAVAE